MKKCVTDFELKDKTVVLRCDFNVSIKDGKIIDDTRIVKSLETINYILDSGARLVILSHLGKVKSEEDKKKNSLNIVYERLNELIPNKIGFVSSIQEDVILDNVKSLLCGHAILLENTRFYDLDGKCESNCDDNLAKFWAGLGDIFINDAFGTLHRAHASNFGISKYLDSGVGFLVKEELDNLDLLDSPERPFMVIMGGAKVSDKISVIDSLIDKVDKLFIGGAMAFTFLKSKGINVGKSLVEDEKLGYCKSLLDKYTDKIMLPIDFYGSYEFSNDNEKILYHITDIDDNFIGMDIGSQSIDMLKNELEDVKTIFWNGPLGVYEFSNYRFGSEKVLSMISYVDTSIIGGGDIVGCASTLNILDKFTFVSTGGGATLEYLVDKNLPGLVNISDL